MPDQRYDANRYTLGSLLSTASPRIEVPEWQRSYSWTNDEVESFWEDLIAFSKRYPDGNINNEEYFLGSIVLVTGTETNLLLDGQQRLATATVLLAVLRDARRLFKGDAATRLQAKYVSEHDDATNSTSYVLTLNSYDRNFFRAEVQDEPQNPPTRPKPTLRSHALIRKARLFFEDRVSAFSAELQGGEAAFRWNLRIGKVLCDHMSVVAVASTDEDNAAEVFETLNDRGIGLSTPDLLRNLLLRRCPDVDTRNRAVAAWASVLEIDSEANVNDFLRHYWVSQRGDVKARKLYREIKDTILNEEIESLQLSQDLADAAPVYRDIVRAREPDADLRRKLDGIRELGAKVLYPALLSGYQVLGSEEQDKKVLTEFADALITLFVRYNVIGGRETTVMESKLYSVAADLRTTKDFAAAIADIEAFSPDATDFVARFQRATIPRIATARYLLKEIEHAKRQTKEVVVEAPDRVHVEHIYPQTPEQGARWTSHAQWVSRLGNLTLLGKTLNISIKNGGFAAKKEHGYSQSDLLLTQELLPLTTWDSNEIDKRQKDLSSWAFQVWHFTNEADPTTEDDGPASTEAELDPEAPSSLPDVPL